MAYQWPQSPIAVLTVTDTTPQMLGRLFRATVDDKRDGNVFNLVTDEALEWNIELRYLLNFGGSLWTAHYEWALEKRVGGRYDGDYVAVVGGSGSSTFGGFDSPSIANQDIVETIRIVDTLQHRLEYYRLRLRAYSGRPNLGSDSGYHALEFVAVLNVEADLILGYVPITIVYCPSGQDMTASLAQSYTFGTVITLGETDTVGYSGSRSESVSLGMSVRSPYITAGVRGSSTSGGEAESQRASHSGTGVEVSFFRRTVVTADNQTTIGRAYWGPLGDLFVVGTDVGLKLSSTDDPDQAGTLIYSYESTGKLIVVPVHKLLRPGDDPEVVAIPRQARRELLALDPFVVKSKLELFLPLDESVEPDPAIPLEEAVDATIDPSADNRAELIGEWFPSAGSDLVYNLEDSIRLTQESATQVNYTTSSTVSTSAGFNLGLIDLLTAGVTQENRSTQFVRMGFQSSNETYQKESVNAACRLVRNQNVADLAGIGVYYDKVFSSLMFRRIPQGPFILEGRITDHIGIGWDRIPVELILERVFDPPSLRNQYPEVDSSIIDNLPLSLRTTSTTAGRYVFRGLYPGQYTLRAGDKSEVLELDSTRHPREWNLRMDLKGVVRIIDLQTAPVWEIREGLRFDFEQMKALRANLDRMVDKGDIARAASLTADDLNTRLQRIDLKLPRTPLYRLKQIKSEHIARLRAIGVTSIQELRRATADSKTLDRLMSELKIDQTVISNWVEEIEARRNSIRPFRRYQSTTRSKMIGAVTRLRRTLSRSTSHS